MKTGIELISEERQRQIEKEGWTLEHDQEHKNGALAMAACCYALPDDSYQGHTGTFCRKNWPFEWSWFKPESTGNFPVGRIKELTKAGALIAAEIDRLQNLKA